METKKTQITIGLGNKTTLGLQKMLIMTPKIYQKLEKESPLWKLFHKKRTNTKKVKTGENDLPPENGQ
jgi:hypothetical protein